MITGPYAGTVLNLGSKKSLNAVSTIKTGLKVHLYSNFVSRSACSKCPGGQYQTIKADSYVSHILVMTKSVDPTFWIGAASEVEDDSGSSATPNPPLTLPQSLIQF